MAEYLEDSETRLPPSGAPTGAPARALAALTSVDSPDVVGPATRGVVEDSAEDAEVREVAVAALTTVAHGLVGKRAAPHQPTAGAG